MEAIADALEKTNWCRKDAARMLGISYKALLYKMRQFNLDSGEVLEPRPRRNLPRRNCRKATRQQLLCAVRDLDCPLVVHY